MSATQLVVVCHGSPCQLQAVILSSANIADISVYRQPHVFVRALQIHIHKERNPAMIWMLTVR